MRRSRLVLLALLVVMTVVVVVGCRYRGYLAGLLPSAAAEGGDLGVPPGFRIAVYAADVPNARQMALGPNGTVFVGTRSEGKVYAVVDRDGDHRDGAVHVLARGLNIPNGVAFRDGALYVAEISRILRFDDIARTSTRPPGPVVVNDAFPPTTHHGWKFIAFGPDGLLYVPVGAPCNICAPPDPRYATIMRHERRRQRPEVVARGVRNTVGFDWQPGDGRAVVHRQRPRLARRRRAARRAEPRRRAGPALRLPVLPRRRHAAIPSSARPVAPARVHARRRGSSAPHVAALGMRFYTRRRCSRPTYRGGDLHRRARLVEPQHADRLPRDARDGRRATDATSLRALRAGLAAGRARLGPPVDVLVMPDGALLVSDDKAGAIYRISYDGAR